MTISAIMNTCNEAHHLRQAVESIRQLVDEVVVCDMESTDGSADLARELGCKVISHRKMAAPEPDARTAAVEAASGDWIIVFDPDMTITPETAQRLRELIDKDEADIVDFHCVNYFFGRWCAYGHGSQPVFRKLFKRSAFKVGAKDMHGNVTDRESGTFWRDSLSGRVMRLSRKFAIRHLAYETIDQCVETLSRYAKREARMAMGMKIRPSARRMIWSPVRRFVANYLFRQGFRDGLPGLIIAVLVSWYVFLGEALLWEGARLACSSASKSAG